MKTAWLFGGHGAQYVGMGRDVLAATAAGRGWLHAAEQASGLPLGRLAQQGPARELTDPRVLEPLLAAVACAHADLLLQDQGLPAAVSGYSAGLVAACYAAGAIDQPTCLAIAVARGEALARAAGRLDGGMLSVQGVADELLFEIAARSIDARGDGVTVAAHNAPMHVVYAGGREALLRASLLAQAAGARTAPIDAAGPWHTPALQPVAQEIADAIAPLAIGAPRVDVWCSLRACAGRDAQVLRDALASSVARPIRWHDTVAAMRGAGVDAFVEASPGRMLWALLGQQPAPHDFSRAYVESPQGRLRRGKAASRRDPAGASTCSLPIQPPGTLPVAQAAV